VGKKRTIDSKIRSSQNFAQLTYRQRDLWQGIIAAADDQGRMHANPMFVRSAVWPYDDIKPAEVEDDLQVLYQAGYIVLYQADNTEYLQILKWWQYQQMQWAGKSDFPPPDGWMDRYRYHGAGRKIFTENWNLPGGYVGQDVNDNDKDNDDDNARRTTSGLASDKGSRLPSKNDDDAIFTDAQVSAINMQWQNVAGGISGFISEELVDLAVDAEAHRLKLPREADGAGVDGSVWVVEAIKEAGRSKSNRYSGVSANFIRSILWRWMQEGYKKPFGKSNGKAQTEMSVEEYLKLRDQQ
jgi:hypothetical protein